MSVKFAILFIILAIIAIPFVFFVDWIVNKIEARRIAFDKKDELGHNEY